MIFLVDEFKENWYKKFSKFLQKDDSMVQKLEKSDSSDGEEKLVDIVKKQYEKIKKRMEIRHSALKLEKSASSKVQKHIFCHFKYGKKSIFAPEKSLKIAFLVVLNFFLVQKLIFLFLKMQVRVFLHF